MLPQLSTGGGGGAVGSKMQNGRFLCTIALRLKKVCNRVSLCENCQWQSCKAFVQKWLVGRYLLPVILGQTDRFGAVAYFLSIFAHSASAVTLSEKSSVNTNRKSTMHFPVSPRWTSYVAPKLPKGAQKYKVSKIWTMSCDDSETVRDRMSVTNH